MGSNPASPTVSDHADIVSALGSDGGRNGPCEGVSLWPIVFVSFVGLSILRDVRLVGLRIGSMCEFLLVVWISRVQQHALTGA